MDRNNYQYGITVNEPIDARGRKQIRDIRGLETPVTISVLRSMDTIHNINADEVDFWVENAMNYTNQYIVRLYGRTNLRGQQQAVFTEVCSQTLRQWMQNLTIDDLSDPDQLTTAYLPHPDIGAMFLYTFRGLISIRVHLQGCQAHVSEEYIFVKGGNPKFSKLIGRGDRRSEGADISAFCDMMQRLLNNSPLEMTTLGNYLETNKFSEEVLAKAINYPAWLPLGERLDYRDDAYAIVQTLDRRTYCNLSTNLSNNLYSKRAYVRWTHELNTYHLRDCCRDMYSVYTFNGNSGSYDDRPLSFLRFCRNYKHHKVNRCTKELAERRLTWLYPNFMSSLHEVFISNGIYVRP